MMEIQLTRGYVAIVDDDDYERLSRYKWHYAGFGYAARSVYSKETGKQTTVYMHVTIMGNPDGKQVDHIDSNKLNNQKSNLRICDRLDNNRNKSRWSENKKCKYKGVTLRDAAKYPHKPYRARITYDGKKHWIGDFKTQEEAARAYNEEALKHFGEYAKINDL